MKSRHDTPFARFLRLSTLMRAAWVLVAVLHAWLLARRLIDGAWTDPGDLARAGLCLAAVGYASLRFWRIAAIFDAAPRRVFIAAMLIVLVHAWVEPKAAPEPQRANPVAVAMLAAPILAAALALTRRAERRAPAAAKTNFPKGLRLRVLSFADAALPAPLRHRIPTFQHRPPPMHTFAM